MAFLSCSKDIILDVNKGAAIEFTVAAHTRAHEVTSNNLMTFYATAVDPRQEVNYFSNLPYIKSGEYYHSSPSYYWPGDGAPLNIYAYAPSATDLGVTEDGTSGTTLNIGKNTQILSNFSPAAEIADQKDFITAVKPEFTHPGDGSSVLLEFKHQLVQIEIKAKNSNAGEIYHVKGVKIAQIKSKGDFDFTSQSWTLDNEAKAVYEVTYDDVRTLDPYGVNLMNTAGDNITESYSDNAMLLPQEITSWDPQDDQQNDKKGAYIAVLMKITTSSDASVTTTDENDGYQWVAAPFPTGTKWEAGNKYIYTLDFTNGASYSDPSISGGGVLLQNEISFDVDIVDWDETVENIPNVEELQTEMLIGKWLFKDGMINISYENETVNEVYLGALEDAVQFGAANTIEFVSEDTFIINEDPDQLAHVSIINGILYLTETGLPSNVTAYVKSFDDENFTLEYYFTARDIEFGENGADLLYTFTFNYIKDTWLQNLIGNWYFDTAMLVRTNEYGQIEERRKLGSVDFAESYGLGISSVIFEQDLSFVININKSTSNGILSGFTLDMPVDVLPDNCSVRVESCKSDLLVLEMSYSADGNTYSFTFDLTRFENTVQQNWRENIVGQWKFESIHNLHIYDDGTTEDVGYDQEFNPAFDIINFVDEYTLYLYDVPDSFEAKFVDGEGFFMDFSYMKFYVNAITPSLMELSMPSRIEVNGNEVYQELTARYVKLNQNE